MIFQAIIIVLGLCVFEIISSVDNAIVNAHVLKTMPEKFRKIFLFWGILIAVFLVRGVLPFLIVWLANTDLGFVEVIRFAFSNDPAIKEALEASKPLLLSGGGIYLLFVALSWLFLEKKKYAFLVEHIIFHQGVWFYAITSVFFTVMIAMAIKVGNPAMALATSIGATAFFITDGLKKNAEEKGKKLLKSSEMGAWSKIFYLEVLDASFSIDGVIGAFAFTIYVPLILIGNGIGAFVVREITIRGINLISKFAYLKNGAMYSIGVLGMIMILESFGRDFPFWVAPLITISLLAIFLYLSYRHGKKQKLIKFS